ncbi:MAG: glycoside hydrolase family 3 C-terminal domain-containing protein [Anaerolineae bacterium]
MTDVESIIQAMTLEEKAALCTGATPWNTTPVERLGVPPLFCFDGPHGVRRLADVTAITAKSLPATCFPTASCQASTWNPALVREMAQAIAEEAISLGADVILGPSNNMKRSPLCGRNFEYYSEDPYLSGELVTAYIEGLQSKGVGASLKHYAANNQEFQRFSINAEVDERALREIYLSAFETAVKRAKPWTVMGAYNKVNGTLCSESRYLLTDILKKEWGYEGLVFSDWGAVRDRVASLAAGTDLEMPGPKPRRVQAVVDAVRNGGLDEAVLNEAVRRILGVVFKAAATPKGGEFDAEGHHTLARKIAGEGIVLLKNDGLLPLQKPGSIAIIGRSAKAPHFQGGGSSHINPTRADIPFDEIAKLAGDAKLSYSAGYPAGMNFEPALIGEAVTAAQQAEVALIFIALPPAIESEGYDRPDLNLTRQQVALIKAVTAVQPRTAVILNSGSAVAMRDWLGGAAAVLQGWLMGQAGGSALADILFGRLNPSGKLAETFPLALEDTPAHTNFPGEMGTVRYGEGLFIGYRYYDAKAMPVQFPFGFGLSYTSFEYGNMQVSATRFKDVDGVTVTVDVTNSGDLAGAEVVQLYVCDREAGLVRPPKELKGFARVELQPGETQTVSIKLDFRAFAFYHPGHGQWITESGEFEILAGASAADIRCRRVVSLQSTLSLPSLLNEESTLREWLSDPRGRAIIEPLAQQLTEQMAGVMGGGEGEAIGMNMMGFMLDIPLLSTLHFQEQMLPVTPEEQVSTLLRQVRSGS